MLCGRLRDASTATGAHAAVDSGGASVYAIWRAPAASGASGQEQLHVLLDLRRDTSACCLHAAMGLADAAERVEELYGVSLRPPAAEGASSKPGEALWALLCAAAASPHGVVPVLLPGDTQPAAVAVRHFAAGVQTDVLVRVPPDVEEERLLPVDDATGLQLYRGVVQHLLDAREQLQSTEAAAAAAAACGPDGGGGAGGEAGAKRPAPMMMVKPRKGAGVAIAVSAPPADDAAMGGAHRPA